MSSPSDDIAAELGRLGVQRGQVLLVNGSLRSLGRVDGGARTLVAALCAAVGPRGTLMVSTATEGNSTTSRAHHARIAGLLPEQVAGYRARMPPFDRRTSVSTAGRIAEELRTTPGAVRSGHPQSSFAALGPWAAALMANHPLHCHAGMRSPLGRLYELDLAGELAARVLLLGVGYQACTALHLAEYRYRKCPPARTYACVITVGRRRRWTLYRDTVLDDSDFELIGKTLEKEVVMRHGFVRDAECRLMPLRAVVDHATEWMRQNRR